MGNLVTISTYDTTVAADLDRIYLEDSGLNVFLADYQMVGLESYRRKVSLMRHSHATRRRDLHPLRLVVFRMMFETR
jgi:hypothetical protein